MLGSDSFCKNISETFLANTPLEKEIPDQKNVCAMPSLLKIGNLVAEYYHVSIEHLYMVIRKKGNLPRIIAIYLAAELSGKNFQHIANFFKNISTIGVSQSIVRINRLKANKLSIANDIMILSDLIKKNQK